MASSLYKRLDSDYSLQLFSEEKESGLSLSMGLTKDKPTRLAFDLQEKHDIARNYRNALIQGLARLHVLVSFGLCFLIMRSVESHKKYLRNYDFSNINLMNNNFNSCYRVMNGK